MIDFRRPVVAQEIKVQFQAGFCAESCSIYTAKESLSSWELVDDAVEWEDVHELQSYTLPGTPTAVQALKLVFEDPTDFYERVTIYRMEVWGEETERRKD